MAVAITLDGLSAIVLLIIGYSQVLSYRELGLGVAVPKMHPQMPSTEAHPLFSGCADQGLRTPPDVLVARYRILFM